MVENEVELTSVEQDILNLLSVEFLSIKQIARRRNKTVQSVYKILSTLKKKGIIDKRFNVVEKFQSTFKPQPHPIRLHGQEFNIQLLFKGQKFQPGKVIEIDNNTIKTYNNSIEVYSHNSFYADDCQKATGDSMAYFSKLFIRLEDNLDIIIMKPRSQNISLVNQHYAEVNNELAKETERQGDKIRVYTDEDGKLWFVIDRSLNCNEAETLHPGTAKQDMAEVVRPFFNDLRTNRPPTLSQVMEVIKIIVDTNKETAAGVNCVANVLKQLYDGNEEKLDDSKNKKITNYFG